VLFGPSLDRHRGHSRALDRALSCFESRSRCPHVAPNDGPRRIASIGRVARHKAQGTSRTRPRGTAGGGGVQMRSEAAYVLFGSPLDRRLGPQAHWKCRQSGKAQAQGRGRKHDRISLPFFCSSRISSSIFSCKQPHDAEPENCVTTGEVQLLCPFRRISRTLRKALNCHVPITKVHLG
jgi:hypothetical protein